MYVKEAHPTDEWQVVANEQDGVCYAQPNNLDERRAIASDFVTRFGWQLPMVVDTMDDRAEAAYAAWPERLYVIAADGTVAYKGANGPRGFAPEEVVAWLDAQRAPEPPPTP